GPGAGACAAPELHDRRGIPGRCRLVRAARARRPRRVLFRLFTRPEVGRLHAREPQGRPRLRPGRRRALGAQPPRRGVRSARLLLRQRAARLSGEALRAARRSSPRRRDVQIRAMMSALELVAVALAVLYLVLVIRENVWCWPAALGGTLLSLVVFVDAKLYMEAALQVFYAAMAVYGWQQWVRGGAGGEPIAIGVWPWRRHALAIGGILISTWVFGSVLAARTDAALPYLDSF